MLQVFRCLFLSLLLFCPFRPKPLRHISLLSKSLKYSTDRTLHINHPSATPLHTLNSSQLWQPRGERGDPPPVPQSRSSKVLWAPASPDPNTSVLPPASVLARSRVSRIAFPMNREMRKSLTSPLLPPTSGTDVVSIRWKKHVGFHVQWYSPKTLLTICPSLLKDLPTRMSSR